MSIVLTDLVKRYGGEAVVDNVSLEVRDGEFFVLLGESGSGKSTILRMIAGLAVPDEGSIVLHGRDVTKVTPPARKTGFMFQHYSLFRHMTVAENVEFGLRVRKVPRAERAAKRDDLLALVGLAGFGRRYPRQLSGGQQQRVAVARALAFSPSVLLLDEPFGALDVKIRGQLRRALRKIQKNLNMTTILVTHDQEEAFELADRIGVIERGHLLEVAAPSELYRAPKSELVASFVGDANLVATPSTGGKISIGELEIPLPDEPGARERAGSWAVLFRPEDLVAAPSRDGLAAPVLGEGTIEEIREKGASRQILVRLEPLPGVWPLKREFGEAGLALRGYDLGFLPGAFGPERERLPGGRKGKAAERVESSEIAAQCPVPMLVAQGEPRETRRVLLCTAAGEPGKLDVLLGAQLARSFGARVTLLHVEHADPRWGSGEPAAETTATRRARAWIE